MIREELVGLLAARHDLRQGRVQISLLLLVGFATGFQSGGIFAQGTQGIFDGPELFVQPLGFA